MSKFDKLFEAREGTVKEKLTSTDKNTGGKARLAKPKKETTTPKVSVPNSNSNFSEHQTSAAPPPVGNKQRGRPKAKRSDPNFIGFTTYIRKDTHLQVKILLLQEGNSREMSELVEELLSGWIKNR